mgnify:FL=1
MELPDYSEIVALLQNAGAEASPAELHGVVVGLVCGGVENRLHCLLDYLYPSGERNAGDDRLHNLLAGLDRDAGRDLESGQLAFRLLLPDDDWDEYLRVEALAQWCEGFLHGLGRGQLAADKPLPDDVRELLNDFAEITRADPDSAGDEDEADAALTEIVEYVRVGVQTIYEGMDSGRLGLSPGRLH